MEKSRFDAINDLFRLSNVISDSLKLAESLAGRISAPVPCPRVRQYIP